MADPVIKKIDTLADLVGIAASGDKLVVIDASDTDPVTKTKLVAMSQLSIHSASQLAADVVGATQIAASSINGTKIVDSGIYTQNITDGSVTNIKLADQTVARNLIYIQLFGVTELVTTTTAKAYFWMPSYLTGKKIKKVGMGLVTAGTSNTTVALSTYASVAGNGFVEGSDISVSLPAVGSKIPINVTAGTGSPKGLDFWFVVGD